ncbi:MAG: hypothetical protein ABSH53_19345 [Holophaga sp.]|jgi:Tfp pilus assembly protein PilP
MRRTFSCLHALSLSAAFALGPGAQGAAKPAPNAPAPSVATPAQSAASAINTEDLMVFNATPYRPTLVRDPFATPTDAEQSNKGDLVDDIAVKGRVASGGKVLAVVSDARGNIRMLPVGFKFRDGVLVAIDDKSVTFHQWDPNGTSRIYRTVVKVYKREEAKR